MEAWKLQKCHEIVTLNTKYIALPSCLDSLSAEVVHALIMSFRQTSMTCPGPDGWIANPVMNDESCNLHFQRAFEL